MAAKTFTSAGVNNLWNNPANWDLGTLPADGDSVTIPVGQTCEYDYDMTAWVTGIAGLTITGTFSLTRTAGTYKLFIKAASTITGAGTFDCGTSISIIPFSAKHLITGGAGWYINGASGLTITVYAAEPVIKTVKLTQAESAGATVLHVDTDITSDIWADGDTVRIDNVNKVANSETRVIASGGRAAGTITITAGLTGAKIAGTLIHLITRNVRFVGVGTHLLQSSTSGITVAGGEWIAASGYGVFYGGSAQSIQAGTFTGASILFYYSSPASISGGIFSGNGNVANSTSGTIVSGGVFSGNGTVILGNACTISGGLFTGNSTVFNLTNSIYSGGAFSGNGTVIGGGSAIINGITVSGNTTAISSTRAIIYNSIFSSNDKDIQSSWFSCFNTLIGSSVENYAYTSVVKEIYSESINHDQIAGAYKAWTKGGVTSSQVVTVPTGFTQAMQTVLENATVEGYWEKEIMVGAGASVNITSWLRKAASMTYLPRVIVFNKASADPFAGGAGLHTFTMTNSIDTWESEVWTYTNSGTADVTLVIRTQGMAASGSFYSVVDVDQINVDMTTALANIATLQSSVNALDGLDSIVEGTYTVQDILKIAGAILAGKVSGGGTTSITFRDLADTTDRIVATVDSSGNRTEVTKTL